MSSSAYRRSEAVPAGGPSPDALPVPRQYSIVNFGCFPNRLWGRDERLGPGSSPASLSFASHRLTIKQFDDVVQIPPRMNL